MVLLAEIIMSSKNVLVDFCVKSTLLHYLHCSLAPPLQGKCHEIENGYNGFSSISR